MTLALLSVFRGQLFVAKLSKLCLAKPGPYRWLGAGGKEESESSQEEITEGFLGEGAEWE